MAKRRMFSSAIVLSDVFLDMPASARCLYFTFGMMADDDGFVNNPRSVMRQIGAMDDDLKILLAKRYVLGFESGVICIKHWRINNTIRGDRYQETTYIEEKATLKLDEKGAYTERYTNGIPTDNQVATNGIPSGNQVTTILRQPSIDKNRQDKDREDKDKTEGRPSLGDVELYVSANGLAVNPYSFWKTFEEKDWMIEGTPVRNWKAMINSWDKARKAHAAEPDEMVMAVLKQMEGIG